MGGVPQRDLLAVTVVKSCIVRVHRCAAPLGMRPAWELRATSARPTELSPVRSPARWRLLNKVRTTDADLAPYSRRVKLTTACLSGSLMLRRVLRVRTWLSDHD